MSKLNELKTIEWTCDFEDFIANNTNIEVEITEKGLKFECPIEEAMEHIGHTIVKLLKDKLDE